MKRKLIPALLILIVVSLCAPAFAQTPDAAAVARAHERLEGYRNYKAKIVHDDFGELQRYRAANAELKPAAVGERRVVFFGDSITDMWKLADYFPGKPYVNRGIGGQTTSQMLVRFRADVIDLKPKVVVILAGTNDIAGNTGPITLEDIESNLASMADMARANNIAVVFASVLPVSNYWPEYDFLFIQRPPEKIVVLNQWIKQYCATNGVVYLDYFGALADKAGLMPKDLAGDGLHPNGTGYKIMAPLAEAAIQRALTGPTTAGTTVPPAGK
jgi:lysophospholipase L1-like esterase